MVITVLAKIMASVLIFGLVCGIVALFLAIIFGIGALCVLLFKAAITFVLPAIAILLVLWLLSEVLNL